MPRTLLILLAGLVLARFPAICLGTASVSEVQSAIDRWIETSQRISEARKGWLVERELLVQEEKLLQTELADLQAKREELARIHNQLTTEESGIAAERAALSGLAESLEARARAYAAEVESLLPYFPEPLLEDIAPLLPRLRAESKASLGERIQAIFGALVEAEKFDRRLTLAYEARSISEQEDKQVRVLYWGLAFALSLDLEGGNPQFGLPGPDGWTWTPRPDAAESIRRAIAIYQESAEPAFVKTPVSIGGPDA